MLIWRALALLVTAAAAVGSWQQAQPAVPEAMARALQQRLAIWAQVDGHQGVNASVILANGAQWNGAAGLAGPGEAMRVDNLVQIGSITKTMTAAIVLQLAAEQRLRLDDAIGQWLPRMPHVDPTISVRQLLNHTSGVGNYTEAPALGEAIAADPLHVFTTDELLAFVTTARFAPGDATEYTNTAYLLLARIAERITGREIEALYRRRLWEPLGLTAIYLPGASDAPAPVAMARTSWGVVNPHDHPARLTTGHGAYGLLADAPTIARWGDALFRGQVIPDAMQREMRTLVPAAGNILGETGAGLGIRSYNYLGGVQYGHSGGASFGSSLLLFDPASEVTVAVVMNQGEGAHHFVLAPDLLRMAQSR